MIRTQHGGEAGTEEALQLTFQHKLEAKSPLPVYPMGTIKPEAKSSLEINKNSGGLAEHAPSALFLLRQSAGSWPNFCLSDQDQRQVLERFGAASPGLLSPMN
jgi:hypothetical protein